MGERLTKNDKDALNPFPIRAHHLKFYQQVCWGENPQDIVEEIPKTAATSIFKSLPQRIIYTLDAPGGPWRWKSYKKKLAKELQRFKDLPGEHPAIIQEDRPDGICAACAIGNHCKKPKSDDVYFMEQFLRESEAKGYTANVIYEPAIFTKQPERHVRTAKTTIGIIKDVYSFDFE